MRELSSFDSVLPYETDALEPVIDQESLSWHHDFHFQDYRQKLERLAAETGLSFFSSGVLEELFARLHTLPAGLREKVRHWGGGYWNHRFFWSVMTDRMEDQEVAPEILQALQAEFRSLSDFKTRFIKVGSELVGSGWVWLVRDPSCRLKVVTTPNNDNPLMSVSGDARGVPLLVCDLWEHAYCLKYRGQREVYLRKFLALINWAQVERNHARLTHP